MCQPRQLAQTPTETIGIATLFAVAVLSTETVGVVTVAEPILATQMRAARGLLDWTQPELAAAADVGLSTVRDFEAGRRVPYAQSLAKITAALEAAGIAFIPTNGGGPGVRLRTP